MMALCSHLGLVLFTGCPVIVEIQVWNMDADYYVKAGSYGTKRCCGYSSMLIFVTFLQNNHLLQCELIYRFLF